LTTIDSFEGTGCVQKILKREIVMPAGNNKSIASWPFVVPFFTLVWRNS
jgi:hypothetical protein